MSIKILQGDCIDVMKTLADSSIDAIVTDPPYGIGFMGKSWDHADIVARAEKRAAMPHAMPQPDGSPRKSPRLAPAEAAGTYDLTPRGMRAFQAFSEEWARQALRVLKPGGHLLSFSSTRTYRRMVSGIGDAGFEIRDQAGWMFGSGFPKSMDVSKAIGGAARGVPQGGVDPTSPNHGKFKGGCSSENEAGRGFGAGPGRFVAEEGVITGGELVPQAEQWGGWGTALKPAWEPICVARGPLQGTVAANVLKHGTGALNIDGCRVGGEKGVPASPRRAEQGVAFGDLSKDPGTGTGWDKNVGRWPANLLHDGSDEVVALFPQSAGQLADISSTAPSPKTSGIYGAMKREGEASQNSDNEGAVGFKMKPGARRLDEGSAARFFWCPKASSADRHDGLQNPGPQFTSGATLRDAENLPKRGNHHPTVKPTELMRYLCRLVTPPGGTVLDPFMGSGSTLKAAELEGFSAIGIELDPAYIEIAKRRIAADAPLFADVQT